ncbi:MAG: formylglycine-generating enzyme family protein [Roseiflexaceae bacterium]
MTLPLPTFMPIPAGTLLMGTPERDLSRLAAQYGGTRESYREESPQHAVTLSAYAIAQVPITVELYACFVRDGGMPPAQWQQQSETPHVPVVNITWPMANDFCTWLSAQTRAHHRLPTEAEWEYAARGTDARQFPWGDAWHPQAAAVRDTCQALPPVGSYPAGASPWGCLDMAGGVWEWTASLDMQYPYDDDGRNDPQRNGRRIIRGGCYVNPHGYARCACRFRMHPTMTNPFLGMRCIRC